MDRIEKIGGQKQNKRSIRL